MAIISLVNNFLLFTSNPTILSKTLILLIYLLNSLDYERESEIRCLLYNYE